MKQVFIQLVLFVLTGALSYSQNTGAYLVPRIVYVGDHAALILPLPGAETASDIALTPSDFPSVPDIDFHRIVLERRLSESRLLVEFTAFVPGLLELPEIEIGGERFAGLRVTITSVIGRDGTGLELSSPAASLAMPGTALMLYGTLAALILLLFLALWFMLRGRLLLQKWIEKWKLKRLFISMKNTEKRLYNSLQRGGNKRYILDELSERFRTFLSLFTGNNCRAMTAREITMLPSEHVSFFWGDFFRRCDELRFSGESFNKEKISLLLDDLRLFLAEAEKAEKEKNKPKEENAA